MHAPRTLVDVLREHAQTRPQAPALTFLVDGEEPGPSLDYATLDAQARAIAATLQQLGQPGDRAILLYPPGLEFAAAFLGCQYAGIIAVPALPPNVNRMQSTVERLRRLAEDAAPALILTCAELLPGLRAATRGVASLAAVTWQASDRVDLRRAGLWRAPALDGEDLSFLQYTSGSTSTPKGVMVSHANLLANLEMLHEAVAGPQPRNFVSWLPVFHDLGLIGMLLHGLHTGTETRLMSPLSFLKRPIRWLRAIAAHGPVVSGGPNFAFEACLRRISDKDKIGLDLSNWKVAFCGAETVRAGTMARFYEAFAPCGLAREALLPCYGLAEATLIVSGRPQGRVYEVRELDQARLEQGEAVAAGPDAASLSVVSCGTSKGRQELAIVDPETGRRRAEGEVGEIWVRGPNVARGYWRDAGKTAATFAARIVDAPAGAAGPYLRTGDLGFMLDEQLYVTGRIKEIIIVRGRCLYPQDLELMVESMCDEFPEIAADEAVAFALPGEGRERLGLIVKINRRKNRGHDADALIAAIQARALEQFEVGFDEIVLGKASPPKTSSGKKMRAACRAWLLADELDAIEPIHRFGGDAPAADGEATEPEPVAATDGRPSQAELAALIVEWIAVEAELDPARVTVTQPLTDFALDSFAAVCLLERLEQRLGTSVRGELLRESRTIAELSARLVANG